MSAVEQLTTFTPRQRLAGLNAPVSDEHGIKESSRRDDDELKSMLKIFSKERQDKKEDISSLSVDIRHQSAVLEQAVGILDDIQDSLQEFINTQYGIADDVKAMNKSLTKMAVQQSNTVGGGNVLAAAGATALDAVALTTIITLAIPIILPLLGSYLDKTFNPLNNRPKPGENPAFDKKLQDLPDLPHTDPFGLNPEPVATAPSAAPGAAPTSDAAPVPSPSVGADEHQLVDIKKKNVQPRGMIDSPSGKVKDGGDNTVGASKSHSDFIGALASIESGNRNIPSGVDSDYSGQPGSKSQGYFQIDTPTWQQFAQGTGVDTSKYPNAMSAPRDIQEQVARAIPLARFGPRTRRMLMQQFGSLDTKQPIGSLAQQFERKYDKIDQVPQSKRDAAPVQPEKIHDAGEPGSSDVKNADKFHNADPNFDPKAFIVHHTGGRGTPEGVENTLKQRGLGVQYIMDREGHVTQEAPDDSHASQIKNGWGPMGTGLSNKNTMGMEVIAKDDKDVTPAQIEAAKKFILEKQQQYPGLGVFGHGEVNPGHKEATEGHSITAAVRAADAELAKQSQIAAKIVPTEVKHSAEVIQPQPKTAALSELAQKRVPDVVSDERRDPPAKTSAPGNIMAKQTSTNTDANRNRDKTNTKPSWANELSEYYA